MTDEAFKTFCDERFEKQAGQLHWKAIGFRVGHYLMMVGSIILAGSAPVVTALSEDRSVPIVLTAVVGIVANLHAALRLKDSWICSYTTEERLRREEQCFKTGVRDYCKKSEEERKATFVKNVESILAKGSDCTMAGQKGDDS